MPQITLNDTNYSGYSADITFSAYTGGSTSLGTHTIPYTFNTDYYFGTYNLYYSQFNKTCEYNVIPSLTITTNTLTSQDFYFYIDSYINNFDLIVNWGDGSPLDYSYQGSSNYNLYHSFPNQLIYTITIQVSDPNVISTISSSPYQGTGVGNIINVNELNLFYFLSGVFFDGNNINSENLNSISISLTGVTNTFGNLYLNGQIPTACPSGDGITAIQYLQNTLGWYVQYDTGC